MVLRDDDVGSIRAEFYKCCSTRMKVLSRKFFSAKFHCKGASGILDTSLLFNMECDANIRKNSIRQLLPSGGTAVFQGTVERVAKEPTALAPTTMNFTVAAPPGVQRSRIFTVPSNRVHMLH